MQTSVSAAKAEGGLVKAKPNQYRTVEALKNDLTPREGRARLLASAKTSVAQNPVVDTLHPGWPDGPGASAPGSGRLGFVRRARFGEHAARTRELGTSRPRGTSVSRGSGPKRCCWPGLLGSRVALRQSGRFGRFLPTETSPSPPPCPPERFAWEDQFREAEAGLPVDA